MNITGFSQQEKEALVDLLILGMYSDGHLASAENVRIKKLTSELGLPTDYERQLFLDAAFNRARQRQTGAGSAREGISELAPLFASESHRKEACQALEELLGSDHQVTESEQNFLNSVRTVFNAG